MRTRRMELLRPAEIIAERERFSVVYLPIAPLEWHGPHNAIGLDALNATAVATGIAERIGGLVMPTLYAGTEREHAERTLSLVGFADPKQYVIGMDYPRNSLPSQYWREDLFGTTVREQLRVLIKQGYKLIVLVNGHAAPIQLTTLSRLAAEHSAETDSRVMTFFCTDVLAGYDVDMGHATKLETSILQYLHPDSVDLSQLPDKSEQPRLPNTDYGLTDERTFAGNPTQDHTIAYDPRDAYPAIGEAHVKAAVEKYAEEVLRVYRSL